MTTNWKQLLKALGLTDSEAQIYLASLEMGPSSVQDIAKKAHVSRVTTYAVIEHLSARGLMSSVEKGKKRVFAAESPERLVAVMQHRLQEMKTTLHEVEDALHELKLVQRGAKPVVKMFEGEEAFNAVFNDMAATKPSELDEFGNLDEVRKYVSHETSLKHLAQSLKNTKRRLIYVSSQRQTGVSEASSAVSSYLPLKDHPCHGDIVLYGKNKVALSSLDGKPVSVIIESETIHEMMRTLFTLAWKQVKK